VFSILGLLHSVLDVAVGVLGGGSSIQGPESKV
jgi:hypothetical protein